MGGLLAIVIGRSFGPEVKGYASLLTIGPSVAAWLCALGIAPAVMYLAAGKRLPVSELLTAATILALPLGVVAAIFGWLVLSPGLGSAEVALALALGLVLGPVQLLREFHGAALLGLMCVTSYMQTAIAARVVGVALTLTAIALVPLPGLYFAIPLSLAISNLFIAGAVQRILRWTWRWSAATAERQLHYGLRSHLGDIIVVSLLRFDQFAVYWILGPTALGLYSVAALVADLLAQAAQAAGHLFFARISAAGRRAPHLARLAVGVSAAGLLVLAVPVFVLADRIVVGIFGPDFEPAIGTMRILAFAGVAQGTSRVAVSALRALGAPFHSSLVHLAGLAVQVPLVIGLAPAYGLEGVAAATMLAHVVVAAGAYVAFRTTREGPHAGGAGPQPEATPSR